MAIERIIEDSLPPETSKTLGIGTGSYTQKPEHLVPNARFEGKLFSNSGNPIGDKEIIRRTRVETRYHLPPGSEAQMGSEALKNGLDHKGWSPDDLSDLIVVTSWNTQDPLGEQMLDMLGSNAMPRIHYVYGACSGFAQALHQMYERRGDFEGKNIAIVATEQYSPHVTGSDEAIFGDHAASLVGRFGKEGDFDVVESASFVYPQLAHHLRMRVSRPEGQLAEECLYFRHLPHPIKEDDPDFVMDGPKVFHYALSDDNIASVTSVLDKAEISLDDIKTFFIHQANGRIREQLAEILNQPLEKFPSNIERFGNTSSASIPLLIDEAARNGQIQKGNLYLVWGFGAGLMSASALIRFN